jgi:hypothetical protein
VGERGLAGGGSEKERRKMKNEIFRVGGYLYPGPIPCPPVHGIMMQPRAINHLMLIRHSWFLSLVIRSEPSDLSDGQDWSCFFCLLVYTPWALWTGPTQVWLSPPPVLLLTPLLYFFILFMCSIIFKCHLIYLFLYIIYVLYAMFKYQRCQKICYVICFVYYCLNIKNAKKYYCMFYLFKSKGKGKFFR